MVTCVCLFAPDQIWRIAIGYSSIEDTWISRTCTKPTGSRFTMRELSGSLSLSWHFNHTPDSIRSLKILVTWSRKIKSFVEELTKKIPTPKKGGVLASGFSLLGENRYHPQGVTVSTVSCCGRSANYQLAIVRTLSVGCLWAHLTTCNGGCRLVSLIQTSLPLQNQHSHTRLICTRNLREFLGKLLLYWTSPFLALPQLKHDRSILLGYQESSKI